MGYRRLIKKCDEMHELSCELILRASMSEGLRSGECILIIPGVCDMVGLISRGARVKNTGYGCLPELRA